MSGVSSKFLRQVLIAPLCVMWGFLASAQHTLLPEDVPASFAADAAFAARARARVLPYSEPATGQYAIGERVMEILLKQLPAQHSKFSWDVRIVKGEENVFSSPDGTIFVDETFARAMGQKAGLWAAVLSHEISHVVRRDWARRYLFQKSIELASTPQLVLGEPGAFAASWVDAQGASTQLVNFCKTMELEADAAGLRLMTNAGFDPDFVPALHHLVEAQPGHAEGSISDPSHPSWAERDQRLRKLYPAAGTEYDRLWPERYASPGGNSPTVVYAGPPNGKRRASGEAEVIVPLHCLNLVGSVEVVLHFTPPESGVATELRQFTGCTSDRALITFVLPISEVRRGSRLQADVSVFDDSGAILARSFGPIPLH